MKKGWKWMHPSMIRSKRKKTKKLPSKIMYDPFVGRMYYNKNGRAILVDNHNRPIKVIG